MKGCVDAFLLILGYPPQVLEEERELSDGDTDLEDSTDLTNGTSWGETRKKEEEVPAAGGVSAGRQAACHLVAPPLERSGRETPVSVDSIPLEWDHTVDVGGSSSPEDDEDATFFSALSGNDIRREVCRHYLKSNYYNFMNTNRVLICFPST